MPVTIKTLLLIISRVCVCVCVCMRVCVRACVHACVCVCVCACVCACMHSCVYVCTHAHICVCVCVRNYFSSMWVCMFENASMPTWALPLTWAPSGVKAGAGKVSQSTRSQRSRPQSADQTLTRRSALQASHSRGELMPGSISHTCANSVQSM